jgi:ferredoxin-nitrite reductase
MMRVRITHGVTDATQLRTLAGIAAEFGRGRLDITTRQQIQLRWLRIENIPTILSRLREVDLTSLQTGMDNVRNIIGCPVAGLSPTELFDASPVARQFTTMFVGDKAFTNLPRKFNVTITGCRDNCTHAETQDLTLVPATQLTSGVEVKGFNVLVGGKLGSGGYRIASPLDVFVEPEHAAELCRAIVLVFRDQGSRQARTKARLAFLLERCGIEAFRAEVERTLGMVKPITIAWSGCPAGCGNHHVADIGLQGAKTKVAGKVVDAVSIFVGGKSGKGARLSEKILEDVPCDELPAILTRLVRYYPRKSGL